MKRFQPAVCFVAALLCIGGAVENASAGAFTRGCAVRDLHILMLIEERESSSAISMEKLGEAMFELERARMICNEGRVADALSLYDSISQSIGTVPFSRGR
jgi:hypothetical protein